MPDASTISSLCVELSPGEQAAAFIATLLAGQSSESLAGRRIVLVGSLPRLAFAETSPWPGGSSGMRGSACVCVHLLRRGGTLVVLDCPLSRLLIRMLLALAADGQGQERGDCLTEQDLLSACCDAAALLVMPGWRHPHDQTWTALSVRRRPPCLLIDLRPAAGQPPDACGLLVGRLTASTSRG
jgi:hypothetical protein